MNKEEILNVQAEANKAIAYVYHTLKTETEKKPLILFDKDTVAGDDDELYDLPIGYHVNKYGDYLQGAIWKVEGDDVTLFFTGEEFGELFHVELSSISFDNQSDLLTYLAERE